MNHLFKATIVTLAWTASLGLALAGTGAPPAAPTAEPQLRRQDRPGKEDPLAMLTAALDLSADQQVQVKALFDDTHAQMKTLSENPSLSPDERMAKAKELHENAIAKVNVLLRTDQQEKFAQFQKEHPFDQAMAGHHPRGMHDPTGELTTALNLTPDQQAQMKALFADVRPQMEAIEADTTLSQEDKKAKLQGMHEAARAKIKGFLTPDQQKTFDQLHKP